MGVCSQKDNLWEYLSAQEHLEMFGKIKGLDGTELAEVVEFYLNTM